MTITIYHNTACGTSRNTLALIRNTGVEPVIIDFDVSAGGEVGLAFADDGTQSSELRRVALFPLLDQAQALSQHLAGVLVATRAHKFLDQVRLVCRQHHVPCWHGPSIRVEPILAALA